MRKTLALLAAALTLTACATAQKLGAANDVHALLIAIRDNDSAAFDAHVDHEALKQELQAKLADRLARNDKVKGLAALLGPSVIEFADQALVQPKTFRMVAEQYGYKADTKIPSPLVIAQALKTLPDGRVCATKKKDGPCVLTFTKESGAWKLTSFDGDFSTLRVKL
jgi:predicted small secreted protein